MILRDVRKNKIESFFIVSIFIIVIMIGVYYTCLYFNFGPFSAIIAFVLASITAFISYYNSDKIILTLNGARPATEEQDKLISTILDNLCIAAGLPRPKLYVIEDSAPNAFATGRNPEHAVICFTTGLIEKMDKYELEGVMAHELAHIKNYDILLSTIVTVFVGFVVILSDTLVRFAFLGRSRDSESKSGGVVAIVAIIFLILSPIFGVLMKLAISRKREYLADSSAVELTRNPEGLKSALTKLTLDTEPLEAANKSTAHMYIVNPFKGKSVSSLFATHPPLEKRIERLQNIQ
ncbi:MAG: M48 family metallopeptidase [Clostridia bacterium]|nr:M48 family metallopeptidase [Clostridia bacterium]MDD4387163.1 M48 family metallopeptidase [Clostridia bacterium]